nr:putative integron gene cassette protein [uncultured bacterium]
MISGVRRRQTKSFSTWGSPTTHRRNSKFLSATCSVQARTPALRLRSCNALNSSQELIRL